MSYKLLHFHAEGHVFVDANNEIKINSLRNMIDSFNVCFGDMMFQEVGPVANMHCFVVWFSGSDLSLIQEKIAALSLMLHISGVQRPDFEFSTYEAEE